MKVYKIIENDGESWLDFLTFLNKKERDDIFDKIKDNEDYQICDIILDDGIDINKIKNYYSVKVWGEDVEYKATNSLSIKQDYLKYIDILRVSCFHNEFSSFTQNITKEEFDKKDDSKWINRFEELEIKIDKLNKKGLTYDEIEQKLSKCEELNDEGL